MADDFFNKDEVDVWTIVKPSPTLKTRDTHFGIIHLDMEFGYIKFLQKWQYVWVTGPGATPLTEPQKVDLHFLLESEIWSDWNSHRPLPGGSSDPTTIEFTKLINAHTGIVIQVSGQSDFARKFSGRGIEVEFDVLVVTRHPHWTVTIHTRPPGAPFAHSSVDSVRRKIDLDSRAVLPRTAVNSANVTRNGFISLPHEFGHTLQNGDEYVRGSHFLPDADSIMNIGRTVRARHFRWLVTELNAMVPNAHFMLPH